jgi:nicotinate phosphoribosyltransferase
MSVPRSALVTDFYQLTMLQGYRRAGLRRRAACFDLFFREPPFGGGFAVWAGLDEALAYLEGLRFREEELAWLADEGTFDRGFVEGLRELRFTGDVDAAPEGSLAFPNEPLLRVTAPLEEAQLVETALLNVLNFQTLIATKAARVCLEAGLGADNVMEFGLRRAQGQDGARTAVRAAYIGGCAATSNVDAAREYGVPAGGTHAHSWVLAFPSELEAFRAYAGSFPERAILLVDTYDTLRSGVPNAIRVAKELRERGQRLFGVRLDSGDLAYLSVETRKLLDEAGCPDVKIVASNNLDEVIIHDLVAQGASIDVYGVGTKLTTGWGDPALSGVYKLSAIQDEGGAWQPRLKLSEGGKKATLPGRKQVWRLRGRDGEPLADWIELEGEEPGADGVWGYHPTRALQRTRYEDHHSAEPLLVPVMRGGRRLEPGPPLKELRERAREELKKLHPTMRRLLNPHEYKVSLGPKLKDLIHHLIGVRP